MAVTREQLEVLKGEARGADAAFKTRVAENGELIGAWIGQSTRMLREMRVVVDRYGALLRGNDWFRALRLGRSIIMQHGRQERLERVRRELLRLKALRTTNAQARAYLQELKYDKLAVLLRRLKVAEEEAGASRKALELRREVVRSVESKLLDVPASVLRRSLKEDSDIMRASEGMLPAVGLQIAATLLGFSDHDSDYRIGIMVNAWYKVYVEDALRTWEARVSLDDPDLKPEEKLLQMINELYLDRQNAATATDPMTSTPMAKKGSYMSEDYMVFWDRLNALGYSWCVMCSSLRALANQAPHHFPDACEDALPSGLFRVLNVCLPIIASVLPLTLSFGGRQCFNDILSITAAGLITAHRQLEKVLRASVSVETLLKEVPFLEHFVLALIGCLEKEIQDDVLKTVLPDMLDEYRSETFVPPMYDSETWILNNEAQVDWRESIATAVTTCPASESAARYLKYVLHDLPRRVHGFSKLLPTKPHAPFRNHWLVKLQSVIDLNKTYSPSRHHRYEEDLDASTTEMMPSNRLFRCQSSVVRQILSLSNYQLFVPALKVVEEATEQLLVVLLITTIRAYVRNKLLLKMLVRGDGSKHIDDQIHWRRRFLEREFVAEVFDKYRAMGLPFLIPNNTCDRLSVLRNAEANTRRLQEVVQSSVFTYYQSSTQINAWAASFQKLPTAVRNLSLDSYILQCKSDVNVTSQWFAPIKDACYWSTDEVFVKFNIEMITTEFMKYLEVDEYRCAGIDKQLVDLYCYEKDAKARRLICDGIRLSRLGAEMDFKNFAAVTSHEANLLQWWCERGKALVLCAPSSIRTLLKRVRPNDVASFDAFAAKLCAEQGPL